MVVPMSNIEKLMVELEEKKEEEEQIHFAMFELIDQKRPIRTEFKERKKTTTKIKSLSLY